MYILDFKIRSTYTICLFSMIGCGRTAGMMLWGQMGKQYLWRLMRLGERLISYSPYKKGAGLKSHLMDNEENTTKVTRKVWCNA